MSTSRPRPPACYRKAERTLLIAARQYANAVAGLQDPNHSLCAVDDFDAARVAMEQALGALIGLAMSAREETVGP